MAQCKRPHTNELSESVRTMRWLEAVLSIDFVAVASASEWVVASLDAYTWLDTEWPADGPGWHVCQRVLLDVANSIEMFRIQFGIFA